MTHDAATHGRVWEMLAGYVAGTVSPDEHTAIAAHLDTCAACRDELAAWQAVRGGTRQAAPTDAAPGGAIVRTVLARAQHDTATQRTAATPRTAELVTSRRRMLRPALLRQAGALLAGQLPLVHRRLWLASALVMALGGALAATGTRDAAGTVLAFIAPMVAAVGLAVVYGPRVDPHLEIAVASPTSPGTVLLARLTLVFGYDLALGLVTSAALSWTGSAGSLWSIVSGWLGPMSLLSAISLAVSVWRGPNLAMAASMTLWAAVVLTTMSTADLPGIAQRVVGTLWSTNVATLGSAAVITLATLLLASRSHRAPTAGE